MDGVTAKAVFTQCETVQIWHVLFFSEAELEYDQESAAVQLNPFFFFSKVISLQLHAETQLSSQDQDENRGLSPSNWMAWSHLFTPLS